MTIFKSTPSIPYMVNVNGSPQEIWHSRSVAVVGVIIAELDGEKYVLIGQRGAGSPDCRGDWNVPCGYLDWDETGPEAFLREIFEETGVDLRDIPKSKIDGVSEIPTSTIHMTRPFYVNTNPKEPSQNVSLSYGMSFYCYSLPKLTTENSEPNEVADVRWVKIKDLGLFKFAFNHDIRIKMFLNL